MKTIFKVGMEVYDQINFPDMKGKVVKIDNDESKYPLGVCFNGKMNIHYYDLEGRFRKEHIPTLSTKPYKVELVGFEQKAPIPTFEDAVNWVESNNRYNPAYVEIDEKEKVFLSETYFYAFEALRKLIILRDFYNDGWQPNYKNNDKKFVIYVTSNRLEKDFSVGESNILTFKTSEIRDKFLEEQKELLEIAKPLL